VTGLKAKVRRWRAVSRRTAGDLYTRVKCKEFMHQTNGNVGRCNLFLLFYTGPCSEALGAKVFVRKSFSRWDYAMVRIFKS